jgi:hypothetical protein
MEDENVGNGLIYQQSGFAFKASPGGGEPKMFGRSVAYIGGTSGNLGVRPSRTRPQASVTMPVTRSTKVSQG